MLTATLTILALLAASVIVWFGYRRTRVLQKVSGQLSGPVEQMKEQLLLTADSAIDRLDGKMAQMEILLSELDRRSNLLAQQSQRQQVAQNQLEQQQQQLTLWFVQQRKQLEQEIASARAMQEKIAAVVPHPIPVMEVSPSASQLSPVFQTNVSGVAQPSAGRIAPDRVNVVPAVQRLQKVNKNVADRDEPAVDKRTLILEMAEQGMSVEEIAKKMSVGKGEVMLLLKLRKKANS